MTAQPSVRELASCAGKQGFESAHLAHAVAKRRRAHSKPSEAYRCDYCGRFHLAPPERLRLKGRAR